MRVRNIGSFITLAVTVVVMYGMFSSRSISAASATLAELTERTHFHGIAVDPSDPSRVLLATHHGLYAIAPDGMASQVSGNQDDYMGFTPHPTDPSVPVRKRSPRRRRQSRVHHLIRCRAVVEKAL